MAYDNLAWSEGQANVPGIKSFVYAIPKADIAGWPTYNAATNSYEGDFTLADGKTFKSIILSEGKSSVNSESQGEVHNATFNNKGTYTTPLAEEKASAFANQANNDDLLYLFQEKGVVGKFRVIGNQDFRAITKPSYASGDGPTSERASTFNVEVTDQYQLPFYSGAIITDEGDVNPSS